MVILYCQPTWGKATSLAATALFICALLSASPTRCHFHLPESNVVSSNLFWQLASGIASACKVFDAALLSIQCEPMNDIS